MTSRLSLRYVWNGRARARTVRRRREEAKAGEAGEERKQARPGNTHPELGHAARLQQLRQVDDLLDLGLFVVLGGNQRERLEACRTQSQS